MSSAVFASANGVNVADVHEHHRHFAAFPGKHVITLLKQPRRQGGIDIRPERRVKALPLSQSRLHAIERRRQRPEVVVLHDR